MALSRAGFIFFRLTAAGTVLCLGLTACSYVGQRAFEDKVASLDQDGDGAPLDGTDNVRDCDDLDPSRAPGLDEIPYDGVDNDCKDGDLVDADGDGFPGVLKDEYQAAFPKATWPQSVVDGPVDCADDPAVYADAVNIFPGNANDPPYDGIDSNCAGDNDFDADGDGFMPDSTDEIPDVPQAVSEYLSEWGITLPNPQYGDCDDFSSDVHPGRDPADDVPYDGVDTDCAGNNDFDADGDGYMPDRDQYEQAYINFVQAFHDAVAPWPEQWWDCLDIEPDANSPLFGLINGAIDQPLSAADVYPGAPDAPYDAIDGDCSCCDPYYGEPLVNPTNDFDADGDGAMPDSASDPLDPLNVNGLVFDDYLTLWGYEIEATYGDCDDTDPDAYQGAIERLGDQSDGDCDSDINGTPFSFDAFMWDNPRPPRVDATDDYFILLTGSDRLDLVTAIKDKQGTALYFQKDAGYLATVDLNPFPWINNLVPYPLGAAVDLVGEPMSHWGSTTTLLEGTSGYLNIKLMEWDPVQMKFSSVAQELDSVNPPYTGTSVDMVIDGFGNPWATGCGVDTVQAIRGDGDTQTAIDRAALAPSPLLPNGVPAGMCFWNGVPTVADTDTADTAVTSEGIGEVVVCEPAVDCEMYDFSTALDSLTVSASNPWAGRALDYGQWREGWHVLLETGQPGARLEGLIGNFNVLSGYNLISIDADWRDVDGDGTVDTVYAVGVGDPVVPDGQGTRVILGYGDPTGVLTEIVLDFSDPARPALTPVGAGVHADDNRLFIGVSGDDPTFVDNDGDGEADPVDAVGWVFFGWP